MKRLLVLCPLFILATSATTTATTTADELITSAEIQSRIDAQGGQKVLWDLWDHETEFGKVISGIESADPAWLAIAIRLRQFSDAGASEELDSAVALALPKAPDRVLALVGHGFDIEFICTSPFTEPEPGVAEAYERKALAALASVQTPALKTIAAECSKRVRLTSKGA